MSKPLHLSILTLVNLTPLFTLQRMCIFQPFFLLINFYTVGTVGKKIPKKGGFWLVSCIVLLKSFLEALKPFTKVIILFFMCKASKCYNFYKKRIKFDKVTVSYVTCFPGPRRLEGQVGGPGNGLGECWRGSGRDKDGHK